MRIIKYERTGMIEIIDDENNTRVSIDEKTMDYIIWAIMKDNIEHEYEED